MNSKMLILGISVIAVGLFAMPTTVSLIEGQHTFINYTGSTKSCATCHSDVTVAGGAHLSLNGTNTGNNAQCRGCHVPGAVNTTLIIPANTTPGTQLSAISNQTAHVAKVIKCTTCHDLALTGLNTSTSDAHRPLHWNATANAFSSFNASSNSSVLNPDDRACIVCHTQGGYWEDLDALKAKGNFTVNVTRSGGYNGTGGWIITYK